jgi:uncharacterized oxidoreductase
MINSNTSVVVSAAPLRDYVVALYIEYGASPADAAEVTDHLLEASLDGHDSHGILRAPE